MLNLNLGGSAAQSCGVAPVGISMRIVRLSWLESKRPSGYRVGDSPIGWAGSYRSPSGPSRVVWKYSPNTGVEFLPKLNIEMGDR